MTDTDTGTRTSNPHGVGKGVRRRESKRFLMGAGRYVDDISLPDMLHAAFVRSSVAHAHIRGIDTSAAEELPGVVGVFDSEGLSPFAQAIPADQPVFRVAKPLATDKVRYVGEPIAVVVATDRYVAAEAADLVWVETDPLPPVTDPEKAIEPDSVLVFEERGTNTLSHVEFSTEGVDEAFARAGHVVRARFHSARITASPMEPRGVIAHARADGRLTVWTSTAGVHVVRTALSRSMRIPESAIEVVGPDIGGSFGGKNSPYQEELAVAGASKKLGRPVKWIETRTEHLMTTRHGRDQIHEVEAAVAEGGRVLALRDRIIADDGAALQADTALSAAYLYLTGPYDIPEYAFDARSVATNKTPHGALRGIGKADASFVAERLMDRIGLELGIDPADVRFANLVRDSDFPYRTATGAILDSGRYQEALEDVLELVDYEHLRKEQIDLRDRGIWRGIGVSFIIEPTSASRRNAGGGYSACRIRMDPSGKVAAFPSLGQQGQGHETTIAQIISDELSIPYDDIEVFENDTTVVPYGTVTGSSRSSVTLMPAVQAAAALLREKILAIAGHHLQCAASDLSISHGVVVHQDNDALNMSLGEITRIAYQNVDLLPPDMDPALELIGYFRNPNIVWDHDELGRRNEFAVYPYDAAVAVVDVDMETGQVTLVRYASVHDCGSVLNPKIVKTQHIGCIVHGVGAALYEELRYSADGDPESNTFMDYLLPTVNEVPELVLGELETPTPFTPLGAKGAGETGMLNPPPAIGNAIEDALSHIGVRLDQLPYSAPRVLSAIRSANARTAHRAEKDTQ